MFSIRMLISGAAALAVLTAAGAAANAASDCSLKQVTAIPADLKYGAVIETKINGTSARLAVDTASSVSGLHKAFAQRIGLPIENSYTAVYADSNARNLNLMTHVKRLELGTAVSENEALVLSDQSGDGTDGNTVGGFAADYLSNYDLEIDPSANKIVLWSQDHCAGKVVYWENEYFATPLLFRHSASQRRPELDVTIDGKTLHAMLWTGARSTVIRQAVVESKLGWVVGTDGTPKSGTWHDGNNHELDRYKHTVQSFSFGDVTLHNVDVSIEPMDMAAHVKDIGSNFSALNTEQPDIYIGMDILRKFHLYLAYGESKLYYTIAKPKQATSQ